MKKGLIALFFVVGASSLAAFAAPIMYPDPVAPPGAAQFSLISEDSVTDPPPLYGAPVQIGDILSFAPTTFVSYSGPNSSDTTSGTLKFDATAPAGEHFTTLAVNEIGDFSVTGLGNSQAYVSGLLTVRDLDTGEVLFNSLIVQPPSPFLHPSLNDGPFQAGRVLQFSGTSTTNIEVVFNNTLSTAADPLSAALIQKKAIDFTVTSEVPEPAAMLLFGIGGVGLLAGRRRLMRSA